MDLVSDKALTLFVIAIVAVPWAIVAIVALVRGYSLAAWRDKARHRKENDE